MKQKEGQYALYLTREDKKGMAYRHAVSYNITGRDVKYIEKYLREQTFPVDSVLGQKPETKEEKKHNELSETEKQMLEIPGYKEYLSRNGVKIP